MNSLPDTGSTIHGILTRRSKGLPKCGAKTRAGGRCLVGAQPGKKRCRFHGGLSTGPKTEAGRTRIAEAQRRRWLTYRASVKTDIAPINADEPKDWLTWFLNNPEESEEWEQ